MNSALSKVTIAAAAVLFVLGAAAGTAEYVGRSAVPEQHMAGTNAITLHIGIAIIAVVVAVMLKAAQSRRKEPGLLFLAPFSQSGLARFKRTLTLRNGVSVVGVLRVVPAVLLAMLMLYFFFRSGMQLTGGLDPNFVVNAWGGPTYLGASLAHWLDGAVLFYIEAALLNMVIVRRP